MSRLVEINQATLIGIILYDSATDQFPRARVYNAAGVEQAGSPFNLTHVVNGQYSNNSWTPTVEGIYFVAVRTFSDAAYTILNRKYENWGETVEVRSVDQDLQTLLTRIGTPAATIAADIAAVKSDTATLTGRLTAGRADNLDNLDTTVSSRQSASTALAQYNNILLDTDDIQARLGTPATTVSGDIAAIQTKLGTPAGATVSADIAAVKVDTAAILDDTGTSGVVLSPAAEAQLVDAVWDELVSDHTIPGSTSNVLTEIDGNVTIIGDDGQFQSSIPQSVERPDTGTTPFKVFVRIYNAKGEALNADFNIVNVSIQDAAGNIILIPTAMTPTDIGQYEFVYNITPAAPLGSYYLLYIYSVASKPYSRVDVTYVTDPINLTQIASAIWDAPLANHIVADSMGFAQNTIDDIYADTDSLDTIKITSPRAANLDNLDASVSSRQSASTALTQYNNLQADTDDIQSKIGLPVSTLAGDVAAVQVTANTINSKIGTPAGVSLSADIAAVKSDTAAILDDTGTGGVILSPAAEAQLVDAVWNELQAGHTTAGSFGKRLDADVSTRQAESDALARFGDLTLDIAGVQADTDDIQSKIGTPVSTLAIDVAAVKSVVDTTAAAVTGVKAKTDQLTFTGANVNANAQVVSDKTDYALSAASRAAVTDDVWDEQISGHLTPGSTGNALNSTGAATPVGIASAVWDALVAPHNVPNTFGNYVQVIRQSAFSTLAELNSPTYGLSQIYNAIGNSETAVIAEVNQNEVKIDAIIPYVNSRTVLLKAEIDQNQILVEALATQLTSAESNIISEVNVVETKVDAVSAQIGTIQNNTTVRFVVPERLIKPTSGTKTYQFHLRLYDETGHAQAPDSTPTIRIRRLDTGIDIVAGAAMTPDGVKVGAYYYNFGITSGTDEYQALVEATVVESGATNYVPAVTEITEFESDLDSIQAQLTSVQGTVVNTNLAVNSGVYGLAALKTGQDQIVTEVDANELLLIGVKSRTDLIPNDPATLASVAAVNATVLTRPDISTIQNRLDLTRDAIMGPDNRNNTAIYDKIDFTPLMKTNDPRLNYLDVAVSSRSTLDATSVWSYGTRELTNFSLPATSVKAVWDYLASQATVNGSLGKRVADMLDAQVSTRATAAQVTSALAGVAQESTVSSLAGLITSGDNQTQILVNAMQSDVSAIQAKTTNLPSDPVSASVVTGGFASQSAAIANLDLKATVIKSKTDNLPPDPAKETTVLQRPTNPLLASDVRVNRLDVNVSTRSTLQPSDIAGLATAAALANTQSVLTTEINQNETKINTVQATLSLVKAKTDALPAQPVSKPQLDAAVAEIIAEVDDECGGGGGGTAPTVAEIWSYSSRTITQDPQSFGPDISNLATKQDVQDITVNTKVCRMSTTLNSSDESQELIVWLENNGTAVTGASNARVKVKSTEGVVLWEANLTAPSADGVFAFSMDFTPPVADRSYYVDMIINDGTADVVGREPFITVG